MSTKTSAAFALLFATTLGSFAQGVPNPPSAAATLTREMSARLQLNEGQYVRLLSLNRIRLARQQEIEQATKNNVTARTAQLAELQGQFEQECSRILTPSQLSQLQQDDTRLAGRG